MIITKLRFVPYILLVAFISPNHCFSIVSQYLEILKDLRLPYVIRKYLPQPVFCDYDVIPLGDLDPNLEGHEEKRFYGLNYVWTCYTKQDHAELCMFVHSCFVESGVGASTYVNQLVDDEGCPINQFVNELHYTNDRAAGATGLGYSQTKSAHHSKFRCEVDILQKTSADCPKPRCESNPRTLDTDLEGLPNPMNASDIHTHVKVNILYEPRTDWKDTD